MKWCWGGGWRGSAGAVATVAGGDGAAPAAGGGFAAPSPGMWRRQRRTSSLQMFADVCRCAAGPGSGTGHQRAPTALSVLLELAPAWPGGQVRLGATGAAMGCPQGGCGRVSPEGTWPWVGRAELRAADSGPSQERVLAQGSPPPPALGTSQRRAPRARSGSSPRLRREQLLLLLKIEAGAAGGSGRPPQPPPRHPGGRIRPSAGTGPLLCRLVPAGGGWGGERPRPGADALVLGASPSPARCTPGQPCLGRTLLGAGTDPGEGTGLGAAGVTEGDSTAWLVLQGWTSPGPLRWEHHAPGPQGMEHPGSGVVRRRPARAPGAVS